MFPQWLVTGFDYSVVREGECIHVWEDKCVPHTGFCTSSWDEDDDPLYVGYLGDNMVTFYRVVKGCVADKVAHFHI